MTHAEFMKLFEHLPQHEQDRIELAYILSKDAHRSQTRKDGERYFEHPRRAALILVQEVLPQYYTADQVAALLMHDGPEDTKYLNKRKIALWFNPWVACLVDDMTKKDGENQRAYYNNLMLEPCATILKGCDRLDNLRSLKHCEPEFVRKQLIGTKKFVMPMLENTRINSTYGEAAAKLMDLMRPLIKQLDAKYKDDITMVPCDSGMHSKGNEPLKPKYRFMCDACEQEYKEDPEAFK